MKWIFYVIASSLSPLAFAIPPVMLSGPVPAISQVYNAGTSTTVIYTVKNNVPKALPLSISGISNGIERTQVANDCNNKLPAGPSTCNLGIMINPPTSQVGSTIDQTLQINYQGRTPLTSQISFTTSQFVYGTLIDQVNQYNANPVNGLLSSGVTAGSNTAVVLAFATVGNVQYAYATDQGNSIIYRCSINTDGTFSSCVSAVSDNSLIDAGASPRGLAFTTINGTQYAYITDINNSVIFQCFFNNNLDGLFDTCTQQNPTFTSGSFSSPIGISFGTVDSHQYAYVADVGVSTTFQCSLNDVTGAVTVCSSTPVSPPSWTPAYVILKSIRGTTYAYVASQASPAIYKCPVNNDGSLSSICTITPQINPPSGVNWLPGYIAFATFSGTQYAYIASANGSAGGGIYRCILDNVGEFQDCQFTGGPFTYPPSYPISVALRFS